MLVAAAVLTGCAAAPDDTGGKAFPLCADATGAVVVDQEQGAIRAYSPTSALLWSTSEDQYTAALNACTGQVFSSSVGRWADAGFTDPAPTARLADGRTETWPVPGEFSKFRVLAATTVGTGVVVTAQGGRATVRTQVDGRFTDGIELSAEGFDWSISPDGNVGVAYEQGAHTMIVLAREGDRWQIVERRQLTEPVDTIFVRDRTTFVSAGPTYQLHNGNSVTRLAAADEFSDVDLSSRHVVLLRRSVGPDGDHTAVRVMGDDRVLFAGEFPAVVIPSARHNGDEVLLSTPDKTITVSTAGVAESAEPGYTFGGRDDVVLRMTRNGTARLGR